MPVPDSSVTYESVNTLNAPEPEVFNYCKIKPIRIPISLDKIVTGDYVGIVRE